MRSRLVEAQLAQVPVLELDPKEELGQLELARLEAPVVELERVRRLRALPVPRVGLDVYSCAEMVRLLAAELALPWDWRRSW